MKKRVEVMSIEKHGDNIIVNAWESDFGIRWVLDPNDEQFYIVGKYVDVEITVVMEEFDVPLMLTNEEPEEDHDRQGD